MDVSFSFFLLFLDVGMWFLLLTIPTFFVLIYHLSHLNMIDSPDFVEVLL